MMEDTTNTRCKAWYAIYTRSRFEKKLYANLSKAGFTTFLPLVKEKKKWHDRLKTVEVPLLPSYIFVQLETTQFAQLYPYAGFVRLVSMRNKPCVIREVEIELLRQIVQNERPSKSNVGCMVGDAVRIVAGPFKGWEGVIDHKVGNTRVVFYLESMQQRISVEVDRDEVERVK